MVLGVAFGLSIGPATGWVRAETGALIGAWVALPGRLFLAAIQFVVVPLVVASVIRGIASGEGAGSLGALGLRATGFFVASTVLAVVLGILVAEIVRPGAYLDESAVEFALDGADTSIAAPSVTGPPSPAEIPELITGLFPGDPLTTFTSGNLLQIVIAAIILGVAIVMTAPEQRRPLLDLLASIQATCMVIVGFVLRLAPFAVFGLLAQISAQIGLAALLATGLYVLTVLLGLFLLLLAYIAVARLAGGWSPVAFLTAVREVLLLAFSTSSSAAVMPMTLRITEGKLAVPANISRFVIPLGTTINMAGTALYQAVATLFLAQVFAVDIDLSGMILIVVMATGAAIGSPGTPGIGIVILASILASVGIPAAGIAILLGVDRLLDMCRTSVNVTGDMVAAITIHQLARRNVAAPARDTGGEAI